MAHARRRAGLLRLAGLSNFRAIASNQHRVRVAMATQRLDADAGRLMLWAPQMSASVLRAKTSLASPQAARNRATKSKQLYQVPVNPSNTRTCVQSAAEIIGNTRGEGEGVGSI